MIDRWLIKKNTKRFYDEIAHSYEALYRDEQEVKYSKTLAYLNKPYLCKVLDVGCGPGSFIKKISNSADFLVGVDLSSRMIEIAKKSNKEKKCQFICADADFLPIRDGVFDIVFAFTLLQNMPNPYTTIREMQRVKQSKGKIAVSIPKLISNEGLINLNYEDLGFRRVNGDSDLKDHIFIYENDCY
jgi:ubiquinone/menaquinone biosynthesis C-methylase UbiE